MAPSTSGNSCLAMFHLPTRATSWLFLASLIPFFLPFFLLALPLLVVLLVPLYLFAVSLAFIHKPSLRTLLVPPWRALRSSTSRKSDPCGRELLAHRELGQDGDVVKEAFATQEHDDDNEDTQYSPAPPSPVAETEGRTRQEDETAKGRTDGDDPDDLESSSVVHGFHDLELDGDGLLSEKPAAGELEERYLEAPLQSDSSSVHVSDYPWRISHDELGQDEEEEVAEEAFAMHGHGEDGTSSLSSSSSASRIDEDKGQITQQEGQEERGRRDSEAPDDLESRSNIHTFHEEGEPERDLFDTDKPVAGDTEEGYLETRHEPDLSSSVHFSDHAFLKDDPDGEGRGEVLSTQKFIPEDATCHHTTEVMDIGLRPPMADIDMAKEYIAPYSLGVEEEPGGATDGSTEQSEEPRMESFTGENLAQPLEEARFIAQPTLLKEGHHAETGSEAEPDLEPYTDRPSKEPIEESYTGWPSKELIEEPQIHSFSGESLAEPLELFEDAVPFFEQPTLSTEEAHLAETGADEEPYTVHIPSKEPIEGPHIPSLSEENLAQPLEETPMTVAQSTLSNEGNLAEKGAGSEPDVEPYTDMPSKEPSEEPQVRPFPEENLAQPIEDTCFIEQPALLKEGHLAETGEEMERDVEPYTTDMLSPLDKVSADLHTRHDIEHLTETGMPPVPSIKEWHSQEIPNKEIETIFPKENAVLECSYAEPMYGSISEEKSDSLVKTSSGIEEPHVDSLVDQHAGSSNLLGLHEGFSGSDTNRKGNVEQGEMPHGEVFDMPTISSEKQEDERRFYTSGMDEPEIKDYVVDDQPQSSRSQAPLDAKEAEDIHARANTDEPTEVPSAVQDYKTEDKVIKEHNLLADIEAIRKIVGCHCDPHSSVIEQIRALYMFLGVEVSSYDANADDLEVATAELELLKAVVGVK